MNVARTTMKCMLTRLYHRNAAYTITKRCLAQTTNSASENKKQPQKTILYDFHVANGGKIVDFAGWLMPVEYKGLSIKQSHMHTRTSCSLFDVSHMMQTRIYGKDRYKLIESLVVSDIEGLKDNTGTLTVFTNDNGGIIDDLIVSKTDANYLYVVSNAGCIDKDQAHMQQAVQLMQQAKLDVSLERIEDRGLLALQGPKASELLQHGVGFDLSRLSFMSTCEATVFGVENCRITRCGYTGEDGVEISVPLDKTAELADKLIRYHGGDVCKLAGLGARDTLRLEAGLCLYGNDIDDTTTPVEAGLAWTIGARRREQANFPGASIILEQLRNKAPRKRVGLKLLNDSGPSARQHMHILDGSKVVGEVTSGCPSPMLKQNILMGYVPTGLAKPGTKLQVEVRHKKQDAVVVKMPFVPAKYHIVK